MRTIRVLALLAVGLGFVPACGPGPGVDASGTWVGTLDFGGSVRTFVFQLHQRAGGRISGYVLGGTPDRTIRGGSVSGSNLRFSVRLVDPGLTRSFRMDGTLTGNDFDGTADDGAAVQPLVLTRTAAVLHERQFLFADLDDMGEPVNLVRLAVVLDGSDAFVAGGWVGRDSCDLWACGGGVTSFVESGNDLQIGLESGGGCAAGSQLEATFNPKTKFYSGTYEFNHCGGTQSGELIGAKLTRTRSDHVASVLGTLAGLSERFESGAAFGAAHPSFSAGYLHDGATQAAVLAAFDAEKAAYTSIKADFRVAHVHTVPEPDLPPEAAGDVPPGFLLEEERWGIPSGGAVSVRYVDSAARPVNQRLDAWTEVGGQWRIHGNQQPGLDLPFEYEPIVGGDRQLRVPTAGGTVHVSLGPYGSHFSPNTGHTNGDAKANLTGFLPAGDSEMTELVNSGVLGVREPGDVWGYAGGAGGSAVRNRNPTYVAPADGAVSKVVYRAGPSAFYFDSVPHWEVELELPAGRRLKLGHLGSIAEPLKARVIAATGVDPDGFGGAVGTDLLDGEAPIPMLQGEGLARPQIAAQPVPGHPGYYQGNGTFGIAPWAQLEWQLIAPVGDEGADVCYYDHVPPALRAQLQSVMDVDMASSASYRYGGTWQDRKWEWGAEGRLGLAYSPLPRDFSSLYTQLGGWFEVGGGAGTIELFA